MDERAQKLLTQYGLSERESLVYLSLLANGKQSAGEIAKAVQIRRMEAYRIIKRLADSGVVVAAPGNPVKYTGEPIEQVVAMMMDRQMKKLEEMEKGRDEVVSLGKTLGPRGGIQRDEYSFRMVQGREQIYRQVFRTCEAAASSLEMVLTRNDLLQLYLMGLAESLKEAKKRGVWTRAISLVDNQTTEASEGLMKAADLRHSEDFAKSRIVIKDKDEVLVSLVLDDVVGRKNDRDVAIWTNSAGYAATMVPLFEKAFAGSAESRARLHELKAGRKAEDRAKAMIDIMKASLPLDGWTIDSPSRLRGESGAEYEVAAAIGHNAKKYAVDVVMGNDEESAKEKIIAAVLKGIELKSPKLVVIGSPYSGEELHRLANLVGVVLIDGADPVAAIVRLRRELA